MEVIFSTYLVVVVLGLVGFDGGGGLESWWPMQIWFTSNYGHERAPCYYHCSSHPRKWSLFFFFFFMLLVEVPDWWTCLQNLGGCCSFAGEKEIRGENSVAATPVTRWACCPYSTPVLLLNHRIC